jgi:hypothetical protein
MTRRSLDPGLVFIVALVGAAAVFLMAMAALSG